MFLPVVRMPAAVAIIWRRLYDGDFGIINYQRPVRIRCST
jgi:multiple sugar transport system permease protein